MHKNQITIEDIVSRKNSSEPLVCLTSYTAPMTKILDPHCDILLVGDSLGMVVYGMENTVGVTLDMMVNHGKAVYDNAKHAHVMIDMPYGTYEENPQHAYEAAMRIKDETGCTTVKLEGGADMCPTIEHLVAHGIHVMAHIGLKPQHVVKEGGYKIKGKTALEIEDLIEDAKAAEQAGAFGILIEGTKEAASRAITNEIKIPTVGIGASPACDGQILVIDDMIGMITDHTPKFVKQYANIAENIGEAAKQYAKEVRSRSFPNDKYVY